MTYERTRIIGAAGVITLLASACSFNMSAADETGLAEDEGLGHSELRKGQAGAIVGQSNYCDDPMHLCAAGEGDCDANAGCQRDLVCGRGKSVQFGLVTGDACVPAHCTNKLRDADETQIDCGGSCGSMCAPVTCGPNGGAERCTTDCLCDIGEGDCDSNDQCSAGLICARSKLTQYGDFVGDACAPAHCTNKLRDADETQIDCGGSCGTECASLMCGPNGGAERCSTDCLCDTGQGDCDSHDECSAGLLCAHGKLSQYVDFEGDACVPAHCTNKLRDGNESQIDCGGSCGSNCAAPACQPNGADDSCNARCLCGIGQGDCDSDDQCLPNLVCARRKLAQYGPFVGDACVPPHCTDGRFDADQGETSVDCGGACGSVSCTQNCLNEGETYHVTYRDTVVFREAGQYHGQCLTYRGEGRGALTAIVVNGAVEVTDYPFNDTYTVVESTAAGFTARRDAPCGSTDPWSNTSGSATFTVVCATGTIVFDADCLQDRPADGCYPNYQITASGSGTLD